MSGKTVNGWVFIQSNLAVLSELWLHIHSYFAGPLLGICPVDWLAPVWSDLCTKLFFTAFFNNSKRLGTT